MRTTVNEHGAVIRHGRVRGWVRDTGCENEWCQAACENGRHWHATPRGFAVTLRTYHYRTRRDAVRAILTASANR